MGGSGSIPIIDVFAGPVGLGEGFSAFADAQGESHFRIALRVEKHEVACRMLRFASDPTTSCGDQ